jgi:chorismate-pyruvate lyase
MLVCSFCADAMNTAGAKILAPLRALGVTSALVLEAGCAAAPPHCIYVQRIELLALLQTLNAELLSHDSATMTLEDWCADHALADPARIIARRPDVAAKPIPDDMRQALAVDAQEPIAYRHVQLMCGEHVLSEADNWYVPSRLTPAMNHTLETTDEPFGKVVKPLDFRRRTFSAQLLWSPLPHNWEMAATPEDAAPLRIPHDVLQHKAILYSAAQIPFSAVVETYTSDLFWFGATKQIVEPRSAPDVRPPQ